MENSQGFSYVTDLLWIFQFTAGIVWFPLHLFVLWILTFWRLSCFSERERERERERWPEDIKRMSKRFGHQFSCESVTTFKLEKTNQGLNNKLSVNAYWLSPYNQANPTIFDKGNVVFSDQHLGAAHSEHWSKYSFSTFFVLKSRKKQKSKKFSAKFAKRFFSVCIWMLVEGLIPRKTRFHPFFSGKRCF